MRPGGPGRFGRGIEGERRWALVAGLPAAGLCCALVACSSSEHAPPPVGSDHSGIIGGVVDDDGLAHPAVVRLSGPAGQCTATLVADNVVLTAWHCVGQPIQTTVGCDPYGESLNGNHVGADFDPGDLRIFTGVAPDLGSTPAAAGLAIFHEAGAVICNRDVALIVLDQPVEGIEPVALRLSHSAQPEELVTAVGYGLTLANNPSSSGVRHRRDDVEVLSAGFDWNYLQAEGEFSVGQSICQGDSGGPLLAATSGAILGVASRGGDCVTASHQCTALHAHPGIIDAAFDAAGAEPALEGGAAPEPVDRLASGQGPCRSGYECLWSLCAGSGAGSFCTQFCDPATASCPSGMVCRAEELVFGEEPIEVEVCVPIVDDGSCESCRGQRCRLELQSCLASPSCAALLDCVAGCTHESCRQSCLTQNPGGSVAYTALYDCGCSLGCQEECADCSLPPDPGGGGTGGTSGGAGGSGGGMDGGAGPTVSSLVPGGGCALGPGPRHRSERPDPWRGSWLLVVIIGPLLGRCRRRWQAPTG